MAEPFLSEIRIFSFSFAPKGWAFCNGQLLPINQNQALFSLLGTTYGGNGQTTFALPDLRARVPIHMGAHVLGQNGGETAHTLTISEMPAHRHPFLGSANTANHLLPDNKVFAAQSGTRPYANVSPNTPIVNLRADAILPIGGSQPHENRPPYLVLSFCIALQGIFPSPN